MIFFPPQGKGEKEREKREGRKGEEVSKKEKRDLFLIDFG